MNESHKHDYWAEHLLNDELDKKLLELHAELFFKQHEAISAQYRIDRLERERTRRLDTIKTDPAPFTLLLPAPDPVLPQFPAKPQCEVCHITLENVMGYVCNRGRDCPTGLAGPRC